MSLGQDLLGSQRQAVGGWTSRWLVTARQTSWIWPALACLAVLMGRAISAPGVDVSALITWAEHLLDGARPYVDFVEVNPPGSVLLYVPAVAVARVLGISPELATVVLVLGLIAVSLGLAARILQPTRALADHDPSLLLAVAIVILGVMPSGAFAQREHIGIVVLLPLLAIAAAELDGNRSSRLLRGVAGLLAGLAMVAKPHFAILLAGVFAYLAFTARNLGQALQIQWYAAVAVVAAYFAATWIAYPAFYSDALPRIADVYLGWRTDTYYMVANPMGPLIVLAALALWRYRGQATFAPTTRLLLIAGAIAVVIFYVQRRGWPYQALPAVVLATLVLAFESLRGTAPGRQRTASRPREMIALAVAFPLIVYGWCFYDHERNLGEIAGVVRQAHEKPRMLAIAEDISIGHPLVRQVQGTWVHGMTHLWSAFGAYRQLAASPPPAPARRERLIAYIKAEIADLARSIADNRPDIILAQTERPGGDKAGSWLAWARAQPAIARELERYTCVARIGDVEILKRTSP